MIGSALKKLAAENGLTVAKGVAYGTFRGYCTTFSEGSGYKQIVIATRFCEEAKQDELLGYVNRTNLTKEYRVQTLTFASNGINIVFQDNPGTMKKIEAFIDWFWPLLGQYGASGPEICPECGLPVDSGRWILRDGVAAFFLHEACAQKVERTLEARIEEKKQPGHGSYGLGILGAFAGAILGSVVWALLLSIGYVASLVGLLIGWLANKGYDLCKGRQGKGKVAILVIAVIIGVLLGTLLSDAFYLIQGIGTGEFDISYGQIPMLILAMLVTDSEYLLATLQNCGMGLLFAFLGVFALLRKTGKEVRNPTVTNL